MRIFKLFFFSILIIGIAIVFVFSLFPSHIRISRVIRIEASRQKTAAVVNNLNTWHEWNELIGASPESRVLTGHEEGPGASISAKGIRMMITESSANSVLTRWIQDNGKNFSGGFRFIDTDSNRIITEWYFDFHFKWYPWEKLGSMFYDKQLGPVMEKSLLDLKRYMENH
ncbi:MAG TPA: SRPBCC family protein [Puia sp.]|nr:SRPBCC family protein [Puia sp.]